VRECSRSRGRKQKISALRAEDTLALRRLLSRFTIITTNAPHLPKPTTQTQPHFKQGRPEQRVFAIDFFLVLRAARQGSRLAVFGVLASDRRRVRRCGLPGLGTKPCAAERSKCAEKVSLVLFFFHVSHAFSLRNSRIYNPLTSQGTRRTSAGGKDEEQDIRAAQGPRGGAQLSAELVRRARAYHATQDAFEVSMRRMERTAEKENGGERRSRISLSMRGC